jgi:hypothetical protein
MCIRLRVLKQAWDDVRLNLRKAPLGYLLKPFFGKKTMRLLSDALSVPLQKVSAEFTGVSRMGRPTSCVCSY